jgi:hypothetical protein
MLRTLHTAAPRPDFLIFANRLFDPEREYEGKRGVAYGGPDLSERNLAVLERYLDEAADRVSDQDLLAVSATGDVHSGQVAVEYLLRSASTFQMHTLFQLPAADFAMAGGSKTEKVLHRLLFDPQEGFIAWMLHLRSRFGWSEPMTIGDSARWCARNWAEVKRQTAVTTVERPV